MKKILLSFLFSVVFVWGVSIFFVNTIEPYEWNPDLKKYVRVSGTVNRERGEGFGESVSGSLGIHGIPDIRKVKSSKVAIWGDSFVDAVQVDDNRKIAQVFTRLSKNNGMDLMAFGIGLLGGAVVDYYFDIPKYDGPIDSIIAHFIVINSKVDVLPMNKKMGSVFVSNPELQFVLKEKNPRGPLFLRKLVYDLNLNFIFELAKSIPQWNRMRFSLGTASLRERKQEPPQAIYSEALALDFMFGKLNERTRLPIIFVYLPKIPKLVDGRFDFTDSMASFIFNFKKKCEEHSVGFIDLTPTFIAFHERTGRFHNGFVNSKPGAGHLNEDGNRLVAEAIFNYVLKVGLH